MPRPRPGTHCTAGWVSPRAGLDGSENPPPPLGFDPLTVQPGGVFLPTELSRHTQHGAAPFHTHTHTHTHTLEARCSGFRRFVTHFIPIVSNFRDCFQKVYFLIKYFHFLIVFRCYLTSFVLLRHSSWNQIGALRCKWVPVFVVAVLYCTALYCTALYCTLLHCTVLHCTALYCTVLYCTVPYRTVLY